MNPLQQLLSSIGAASLDAASGYQQFRTIGESSGSGGSADVERIERDHDVVVVVTVWEWAEVDRGTGRDRLARLVFDEATGRLLEQESQGNPADVVRHIGGMKRMAA